MFYSESFSRRQSRGGSAPRHSRRPCWCIETSAYKNEVLADPNTIQP